MSISSNQGDIIHTDFLRGSDLEVGAIIGRKVVTRPGFLYGTLEAIVLGASNTRVKISGEWIDAVDDLSLTLLD